MSEPRGGLADDYALALERYLAEPEEPALARAHELGRLALTEGLGVLEMAAVHSRALAGVLSGPLSDADRQRLLEALERFFVEALSPFEMAHRGFRETHVVLHRLNDLLEGQTRRIAFVLHDEAAQLLASVHLALADVASRLPPDRAKEIQTARRLLDQIEGRLRNLAHELRPPILDDLGLVPALEFLADGVSKRWGLAVSVHSSVDREVPSAVATSVYRIAQEALTNVAKHARAGRAQVTVRQAAGRIICSVCDDGVGIDLGAVKPRHGCRGLGLVEIQERVAALGGVFRVGPNHPRGTDLTVEIPVDR